MILKRTLALLLSAMLLTLTACGGGAASSAPAAPATSASESAPAAPAASASPAPEASVASSVSPATQPECVLPAGEKAELRVAALKGPSAVGMLSLMEKNDAGTAANHYTFTLAGAPDQLVGSIIKGEFDIAVLPTNLAATLYNKTEGKLSLATINTLGVLYLVENGDTIKTVADLAGKTIYATGKGATPEYVLNYVLEQNGLKVGTDVKVEYKGEHTELATLLAAGQADIALLPQPFVTTAMAKNDKLRVALDMTAEWNKAAKDGSALAMSGIVVQKKLLEENPAAVEAFLTEYETSTRFATDPATLDAVSQLAVKYEVIPAAAVAKKAIPQCNIVFVSGEEMKKMAGGFLQVLFAADPKSVGGKLPDEKFYYIK